tara:strand:- start:1605 stop:1790 length:186 start_codon:yes stop_codon:yes gene_type:complete
MNKYMVKVKVSLSVHAENVGEAVGQAEHHLGLSASWFEHGENEGDNCASFSVKKIEEKDDE